MSKNAVSATATIPAPALTANTFSVLPKEAGACEVTITTQWRPSPGLRGLLERFFSPRYVRGMLA